MNIFYRSFLVSLAVSLIAVSCAPSNQELEDTFTGVRNLYKGFLKVLNDNKTDISKATLEAEKYVASKESDIKKYSAVFSKKHSPEQVILIKKFNIDVMAEFTRDSLPLKDYYEKNKDVLGKINSQIQKLNAAHRFKE